MEIFDVSYVQQHLERLIDPSCSGAPVSHRGGWAASCPRSTVPRGCAPDRPSHWVSCRRDRGARRLWSDGRRRRVR